MKIDFTESKPVAARKTAARRQAEQQPKPLILDFSPTKVYMRDRTHTYLWLRETDTGEGLFLTMDNGSIALVRLPLVVPEGQHHGVYRVYFGKEDFDDLVPFNYDFKKAIQKYHSSLLARTTGAENEMRAALGLEALAEGTTDADLAVVPVQRKRAVKGPSTPTEKQSGGYSLQTLCEELKLDPAEARKALRQAKVQKPGGRWEWPNAEAAAAVRAILEAVK